MNTKDVVKLRVVIQKTPEAPAISGSLVDAPNGAWFMFADRSGLLCKRRGTDVLIFCLNAGGKLGPPFRVSASAVIGSEDLIPIEVAAILPVVKNEGEISG